MSKQETQSGCRNGWRNLWQLRWLICLFCFLHSPHSVRGAEVAVASESQVKAAFLLNFPKYVDWPASVLPETNTPIRVTIIGNKELSAEFGKMCENKVINGHPIVLTSMVSPADCDGNCHIVFVASASQRELLDKLRGKNALTVGESDDFIDLGGVINLTRHERKIRLQVNLTAARNANLTISSKLMSVADVKR